MKKPSEPSVSVDDLIGLGGQSARKSYYPALQRKIEELENERNRYKWLFENALHGIFQASMDGLIERANPTLARICAVDDGVLTDGQVTLSCLLEGGEEEFAKIRVRLASEGQLFLYQTRLKRSGGGLIHVSMHMLLRPDEHETIIEGFVADITERVRMQNQMQAINEALEQRVSERTYELLQLNDRLREEVAERHAAEQQMALAKEAAENANRSKDKYLAAASHDLLQPLNAARLLVSALREREIGDYEGDLVERVHRALSGAEHLLSDLLDISKLDQNAVQPDMQSFPLSHLLRNMEAEFQSLAHEAGLAFRIRAPNLAVRSDLRLLSRILRNLIGNAIRYTENGTVLLSMRRRGDQVLIEVWDTGPGIPNEQREEIFLEFRQLKKRGPKKGGVGLGLAIVDRIARVLGYHIQLDSIEGKGSRFGLLVPLADGGDVVKRFEPVPHQSDALKGERILVVDNEPEILVSMRALLEGWGCRVSTVESLDEALEARLERPAMILADYHLDNDATGIDAVQKLRKYFNHPVPAAILTADRSGETRRLFREKGLAVLNKPLKPGKLRALMNHLLEQ
ncbi:Sensory box histidine kinase/response regulator [Marinobacterium lacunae]|uniref:histidine kinase n=1 Tax=Marinobacterium lacunae TaxID=1232683 RepID=A0A081FTQ2_9GAMM|nr:NahK/ErcS family hybrid sensor histidine kinase/response regulator [Marinobacterium lacunae]KEA61907.1 Sensory box histidine kinase/response regulator [Marinobacterium lacunae]MBR9883850.1 response regulator [Oceanospirillales bacterium]